MFCIAMISFAKQITAVSGQPNAENRQPSAFSGQPKAESRQPSADHR
jgi:hypothetical protein